MDIFPHPILVLTRIKQIEELFSYQPGLDFLLTLRDHYHEGWVRMFYATIWIDPQNQFIIYMFKGQS